MPAREQARDDSLSFKQTRMQDQRDYDIWNALPRHLRPLGGRGGVPTARKTCWRTGTTTRTAWVLMPRTAQSQGYDCAKLSDSAGVLHRPPQGSGAGQEGMHKVDRAGLRVPEV